MRVILALVTFIWLPGWASAPSVGADGANVQTQPGDDFWLGWTLPVNVSQSPKTQPQAMWPTLGVSGDGQVVYLAWSDDRGGSKDIYYAASVDNGFHWGVAQPVATTALDSLRSSLIVSDTTALIAWADEQADKNYVTYQTQLGVDAPLAVPNARAYLASTPRLAWGADGELHLTLPGGLSNQTDILYSHRSEDAVDWPAMTVIFTHTAMWSREPTLAISPDGQTLHLVWQETFNTTHNEIYYKRASWDGAHVTWELHKSLSQGITNSVRPDIAVGAEAIYAVWAEPSSTGVEKPPQYVRFSRSEDGGHTWSTPTRVFSEPVFDNDNVPSEVRPVVAVTPSGAVCAAWHGFRAAQADQNEEIFLSCSTDRGEHWSTPVNVSRTPNVISIQPALVAGSDGILHMAWQELAGNDVKSNYEIFYARSLPYQVMLPLVAR